MKIQMNDAGSWRHIATFEAAIEEAVRKQTVALASLVQPRARLRVLYDDGAVKAYSDGPEFEWRHAAMSSWRKDGH